MNTETCVYIRSYLPLFLFGTERNKITDESNISNFSKGIKQVVGCSSNVMLLGAHEEAVKKPIISLSFEWINKIVQIR